MEQNQLVANVIRELQEFNGAKFASFIYRAKETQELAKVTVILSFDMRAVYDKDIATLDAILADPTVTGVEREAAMAIHASLIASTEVGIGSNPNYVHGRDQGDTYVAIPTLPGVKVHRESGELYVYGLVERKEVLEEGTYKVVNSKPLTLAKKKIDKQLRRGKIRQYALGNLEAARMNGLEFGRDDA